MQEFEIIYVHGRNGLFEARVSWMEEVGLPRTNLDPLTYITLILFPAGHGEAVWLSCGDAVRVLTPL